MKKINGFTITKLTMSGFKCFEDSVSFDFGDTTYITASNGQGKSSIADAIAFAFAGTPFFGEKGLDRLHNKNAEEMTVSVDFVDDKGEKHNLTRIRKRDVTSIAFDCLNVKQSFVNTVFGDKDVFLSILNPLYFINVLGDGGKSLLEKLLPIVSHEEVLAALPGSSQEVLSQQSLSSPETFIKNRRGELKQMEDALIGYRSQKELVDRQREERAVEVGELQANIEGIAVELAELAELRDSGRDIVAEESMLAELRKQRNELLSSAADNGAYGADGTYTTMQKVMSEIKAVEKAIAGRSAAQYVSSCTAKIAEVEAGLRVLYDEHARINKALADVVVGYKCPACAIVITADNIDSVKADLQSRLSALVNDGKTAKTALAEIKAQDGAAKRVFEEQKVQALAVGGNKLAELNQRLHELNVARELDSEDYGERILSLESQISERERRLAYGNLTEEQVSLFAELEKSKRDTEAKIETLGSIAGNKISGKGAYSNSISGSGNLGKSSSGTLGIGAFNNRNLRKSGSDASDSGNSSNNSTDCNYTILISKTEAEIIRLKRLVSEAIQYMAKRIELMLDGLKMSNTEIVLTEIVKTTGEIKDCFRFSYDGRDYRCLSLSEKVRAGLEVSVLIQRLAGRMYPVFVDNGESICSFGGVRLPGQVIISRVVGNQGLQVTHKNRERANRAA